MTRNELKIGGKAVKSPCLRSPFFAIVIHYDASHVVRPGFQFGMTGYVSFYLYCLPIQV